VDTAHGCCLHSGCVLMFIRHYQGSFLVKSCVVKNSMVIAQFRDGAVQGQNCAGLKQYRNRDEKKLFARAEPDCRTMLVVVAQGEHKGVGQPTGSRNKSINPTQYAKVSIKRSCAKRGCSGINASGT